MRKSLQIVPVLLLFAAIGAPSAHAQTYVITYTETYDAAVDGFTVTTDPLPPVTSFTTIPLADLASYAFTGSAFSGSTVYNIELNPYATSFLCPAGPCIIVDTSITAFSPDYFPAGAFTTPGTYLGEDGDGTLTVTEVTTPEPAAGVLMLTGIGFLVAVVMRRRSAKGLLPSAT